MKEVYLDLSDKIFIHKDFVEVIGLKLPKGKDLIEVFEQNLFGNTDKVVIFKLSVWKGVKLESIFLTFEEVYVMLRSKVEVVGLEYY